MDNRTGGTNGHAMTTMVAALIIALKKHLPL
jgi:hypothetical protein